MREATPQPKNICHLNLKWKSLIVFLLCFLLLLRLDVFSITNHFIVNIKSKCGKYDVKAYSFTCYMNLLFCMFTWVRDMRGTRWLVGYVDGAGEKVVWIKWIMLVYNISVGFIIFRLQLILARGHILHILKYQLRRNIFKLFS